MRNALPKKIIGVLFLTVLFLSCDPGVEEEVSRIGFSQAMTTDNWRKAMNKEMMVEASMYASLKLEIADAENDIKKQIAQIERFIEQDVDVLIVSPIQSVPVTQVIEKAMNAGIPTIVIDRKIEGSNFTSYVGANNVEIGKSAAKFIRSHANKSAKVLEIKGQRGSSPAFERSEGFREVLDSVQSIQLVGVIDGNWEKESVKPALEKMLDTMAPPDFIFAHNDRMALGAWEAAKAHGLQNQISIVGVDGLFGPYGGIQLVKENILDATILYPTGGAEAIKAAKRLSEGESVNKNIILNTVVIDPVNADIMKNQFEKMQQQQFNIEQQQEVIDEQITTYKSQGNLLRLMSGLVVLLILLSLWSVFLILRIKKSKRKLEDTNQKIIDQRNQIEDFAQQLKKSNESRINFFTALSHEFKTPLTLITSAIESISEAKNKHSEDFAYEASLITHNSRRLLRLINELLDFRKLESGSFAIKPVKTNLYEFLERILENFKTEAVRKSIDLKLEVPNKELMLYIDRDLMDKVFFNLLSNAFKFTPKNGAISIAIKEENGNVEVRVKDSGIGIPKDELSRIFDPYIQGTNNKKPSSGLGLYISRQFVELHKGTIAAASHHGSEFVVVLLKGKEHLREYHPSEVAVDMPQQPALSLVEGTEEILPEEPKVELDQTMESILVIEDNQDLSRLLKVKLSTDYNVYLSDGTDAVTKALELVPDVIICDINLPDKDGYEICRELKDDLRSSHIPILILSALSDVESKIKSLQAGADGFIAKPFNFQILRESLRSALYNREKMRYYFTNKIDQVRDERFENTEQAFLKNLNRLVEENIGNADFTVEDLAQKLNISRVQLYRKVKAILGITVSEYLNTHRLNKSKYLLQETDLNIAEIAYSVGFSSPGYFSTSFKNKFGVSPTRMRD